MSRSTHPTDGLPKRDRKRGPVGTRVVRRVEDQGHAASGEYQVVGTKVFFIAVLLEVVLQSLPVGRRPVAQELEGHSPVPYLALTVIAGRHVAAGVAAVDEIVRGPRTSLGIAYHGPALIVCIEGAPDGKTRVRRTIGPNSIEGYAEAKEPLSRRPVHVQAHPRDQHPTGVV